MNLDRKLVVLVDNISIADNCRVRLRGNVSLSLYPELLTVSILNLSDIRYHLIREGGTISVVCGASKLASGIIHDVSRETSSEGVRTVIGFSLGFDLWEKPVSISLGAGHKVSETVNAILRASEVDFSVLSFPGHNPTFERPQAYCCRAAEAVEIALTAARARACLVPSGMVISPEIPEAVEVNMSSDDLTNAPIYTVDCVVIPTKMVGWPMGRRLRLKYGEKTTDGIIIKQMFDADTLQGPWKTEVMAEVINHE